ncbi:MAG TPA: hypothetical protein VF587_20070 [Solirubrobacteraceae bacterium]|jgi:hypothetical protein
MRPLLAVVCALLLLAPATALADPFDDVFADYQKDGKIDPCAHSPEDLQKAKADIPNDIEQYAPDFPAELDAAMEERARGCDGSGDAAQDPVQGGAGTPGATGGTSAPPAATTPNTPGQAPAPPGTAQPAQPANDGAIANAAARDDDGGSDVPAPLVALAVLGALLALSALIWGLFRFFAWEPRWLLGARHSVAEAGWRTGGAWADFTDWLRSRRKPA